MGANALADATKLASNSRRSIYDPPPAPPNSSGSLIDQMKLSGWGVGPTEVVQGAGASLQSSTPMHRHQDQLQESQAPPTTRIVASPLESWIGGAGSSWGGGWGGAGMFVEGEGRRRMLESLLFGGTEIARARESGKQKQRELAVEQNEGRSANTYRQGISSRVEQPLGARAVQLTLKLALDYEYAGKHGTGQRALFLESICQDLARASCVSWIPSSTTTSSTVAHHADHGGLPSSNFQIQRVAIGSVPRTMLVDLYVHSDPGDHFRGFDAASVAGSLELQARDASSVLRNGVITRHVQSITLYGLSTSSEDTNAWNGTSSLSGPGSGKRGSGPEQSSALVELVLNQDYEEVVGKSEMQAALLRVSIARFVTFHDAHVVALAAVLMLLVEVVGMSD